MPGTVIKAALTKFNPMLCLKRSAPPADWALTLREN
jgi:hypothetical protein